MNKFSAHLIIETFSMSQERSVLELEVRYLDNLPESEARNGTKSLVCFAVVYQKFLIGLNGKNK